MADVGRMMLLAVVVGLISPQASNGAGPLAHQLEEFLAKLTNKPEVKATLAIDRASGAILKSSGDTSFLASAASAEAGSSLLGPTPHTELNYTSTGTDAGDKSEDKAEGEAALSPTEKFAGLVWRMAQGSEGFLKEIDDEVSRLCLLALPCGMKPRLLT